MIKHYAVSIMIIFFQFNLYITSYAIIANTQEKNSNYRVTHKLDKKTFSRELPQSIIELYEKTYNNYIPANELFSEPVHLLMLYDLLKQTIDTLAKYGVDYWLTGETLTYYYKINSLAPWQKNTHIAINYDQFRKSIKKITQELKLKGIVFNCFENLLNLKHATFVTFNKQGFINSIKKNDLSYNNINHKYTSISNQMNPVSLYFYPYKVTEKTVYNLIWYLHDEFIQRGGDPKGWNINCIYPLKTVYLVDLPVNIASRFETLIHADNYGRNFYKLYVGRSQYTYHRPLVIEDLRNYEEFKNLMIDFLEFTFQDNIIH